MLSFGQDVGYCEVALFISKFKPVWKIQTVLRNLDFAVTSKNQSLKQVAEIAKSN
jgi:hypothetical protein